MIRNMIKKTAAVLLATGLGISMICPQVSAATKLNMQSVQKAARYIQPEEWNREEIKAYQFDTMDDFDAYQLTGGTHLYDNNYKGKDRWVKVTVVDPGIFIISAESGDESIKVPLYDETKTKILSKNIMQDDESSAAVGYAAQAKAGDVFYVKLPAKMNTKVFLSPGVIKDGFTSMKDRVGYFESGKGTTVYHTFSLNKRAEIEFSVFAEYKNAGNGTAVIQKYVNGKWTKIGYMGNVKPRSEDDLTYGLQKGKYRIGLNIPKGQIVSVSYVTSQTKKKAAYKKSKAKKIDFDVYDIYTQGEKAARWYKTSVTTTKYKNQIIFSKDTVGGGYKFSIYKKGKKKAIKTVKVTKNNKNKKITLPKQKGIYYVRVSKLTNKTNGLYKIEDDTY